MKNKKGFTLVELLSVIVVLAIIIAIAVPAYGRVSNSINQKQYQNKLELIKVAALKYADDTNYTAFYIDDLVLNGYLDADSGNEVLSNIDNSNMNCYIITISEDAELNYANIDTTNSHGTKSGECDTNIPNEMSNFITIEMYDKTTNSKITYNANFGYWTKNDVQLKLKFKSTPTEGYTIEWLEGLNKKDNNTDTYDVSTDSVLQQNYTARVTMASGKKYATTVRVYIDKIAPKFYTNDLTQKQTNDKWVKQLKYNIQAYDSESGLYAYKFINNTESCPTTKEGFSSGKRKNDVSNNGEYKVCLIDNVGNISEGTLKVTNIDKTDLECEIYVTSGDKGNGEWYKSDVTIAVIPKWVGLSGVTLAIDSQNKTWPNQTYSFDQNKFMNELSYSVEKKTVKATKQIGYDINGNTYYGFIKNPTGEDKRCSKRIYIEKTITAPTFTASTTTSTYNKITATYSAGSAISGIANSNCYLTDASGNITANGSLSGNNCEFNVTATQDATTYYFKKCITSNAGNTICSGVNSKANVGYCSEGHYTTSTVDKTETVSCGSCGKAQSTYTYKYQYTSKYQNKDCGKSDVKTGNDNCAHPDCCSETKTITDETKCSEACGGKSWQDIVSAYDSNYSCGSGGYNGPACGGHSNTAKSSGVDYESSCPTDCGQDASKIWGTPYTIYRSNDNTKDCRVNGTRQQYDCPATDSCCKKTCITSISSYTDNSETPTKDGVSSEFCKAKSGTITKNITDKGTKVTVTWKNFKLPYHEKGGLGVKCFLGEPIYLVEGTRKDAKLGCGEAAGGHYEAAAHNGEGYWGNMDMSKATVVVAKGTNICSNYGKSGCSNNLDMASCTFSVTFTVPMAKLKNNTVYYLTNGPGKSGTLDAGFVESYKILGKVTKEVNSSCC